MPGAPFAASAPRARATQPRGVLRGPRDSRACLDRRGRAGARAAALTDPGGRGLSPGRARESTRGAKDAAARKAVARSSPQPVPRGERGILAQPDGGAPLGLGAPRGLGPGGIGPLDLSPDPMERKGIELNAPMARAGGKGA